MCFTKYNSKTHLNYSKHKYVLDILPSGMDVTARRSIQSTNTNNNTNSVSNEDDYIYLTLRLIYP